LEICIIFQKVLWDLADNTGVRLRAPRGGEAAA